MTCCRLLPLMCLMLGTMPAQAQETSLPEKLVAQVKACLKIPAETLEYNFRVTMVVTTDSKGRLSGEPVPLVRPKSPAMKAFVEATKQAIVKCGPYPLVPNETLQIKFAP